MRMTAAEIKEKYLNFFKARDHAVVLSAPLVPENDPTVLFTTAGMHPLVPFLLGEKHPAGHRLVDVQKCIRTSDINDVGDNWHLTFFEMLGNWSFGDPDALDGIGAGYWKKEAIEWSFEFLTDKKWLGIPLQKLRITVFSGDEDAPRDEESAQLWQKAGISKEKIYYLPKEDNWWGPAGKTGPCGPCTEMFYDTGKPECSKNCRPGCGCGKYVEIWNDVFMEYNKTVEGKYKPLKQKNVDTGMGIERVTAALSGFDNVYQTELFKPIIEKIKSLAGISEIVDSSEQLYHPGQITAKEIERLKSKAESIKSLRIIADHIKAAVFILAEGIEPSNTEHGYVLRRLIRRAIRHGKQLNISGAFTFKVAQTALKMYQDFYPELAKMKDFIEEQLTKEEEKFGKTLEKGLKELDKLFPISDARQAVSDSQLKAAKRIDAGKAFYIYQTYGFPLEMIQEELAQRSLSVDEKEFAAEMKKHQELSRTTSAGRFKGGLADDSEKITRLHTTTHLLLAALRQTLGSHVIQRGSNITAERLRFDFSHSRKLSEAELKKVEELVNQKIQENLPVKSEEMNCDEALNRGALGVFPEQYGEIVKVYTIGDKSNFFSQELCNGPHVQQTGQIGQFKILKEEAVAAGVRRIRADVL